MALLSILVLMITSTLPALAASLSSTSIPLHLSSPLPLILSKCLLRHPHLSPTLFLTGNLGAGKTTFSSSIIASLTPHQTATSPTFLLQNTYTSPTTTVNHIDCYRLGPNCLHKIVDLLGDDALGDLHEHVTGEGEKRVTLVEWAKYLSDNFEEEEAIPRLMDESGGSRLDVSITIDDEVEGDGEVGGVGAGGSGSCVGEDGRLQMDFSDLECDDKQQDRTITFTTGDEKTLRALFDPVGFEEGEEKDLLVRLQKNIT